jgi:xanthine dehydrogenase YagS FAD-binding subunit
MRPFTYTSPHSIDEAVMLLAPATGANGSAPRALAGGTDLLTLMKADLLAPEQLIDIKRLVDLDDGITEGPEGLTIGSLATLA